jgi:hypothetical protein
MNFKVTAINMVYTALRWYAGTGVFDRVIELVEEMKNADLSNSEKRERVVEWTKKEFAFIRGTLVRAIIEIYLLKQLS